MPRWLVRRLGWGNTEGLAFVAQAVLFGMAFSSPSPRVWLGVFVAAALINLVAWLIALGWRRAIVDTPTSRIASAAQGYVELIGAARPLPDTPLFSPFTLLPCLWYSFSVERRRNGKWQPAEQGQSETPFLLDDGSGRCEVDPLGAHILTTHKEVRTQGDERHTERLLLNGDRLYALGDFVSYSGARVPLDRRIDIGNLLAEWKLDGADLQARFDLDRSGDIDTAEWQLARQAAEREVERRHQEIRNQPTWHRLQKPRVSKPYLIANYPPEKLGRRYAWIAAAHLGLLLGCLFGIAWALHATG
jgi:hypothetical protein